MAHVDYLSYVFCEIEYYMILHKTTCRLDETKRNTKGEEAQDIDIKVLLGRTRGAILLG